jgi:predicted ATPase
MITLTGPPGVGKTRLGLAVAWELRADYPDGVFFVALGPLADPGLVGPAVRQALGLTDVSSQPVIDGLAAHLASRRALLFLDNFEHVLPAAPLVTELLGRCPELRLIVTSRASLHLRAEHLVAVPPLRLPDPALSTEPALVGRTPAVALFVQRAEAGQPDFELTARNATAVAGICRRLDGLPLALELAAPWVKLLPPERLLARLEERRLPVLVDGARDLPERQRTLRSTLEWSCDLLSESEQALFRRLGVFAGGTPLEALETVCQAAGALGGDVLGVLAGLVDKNLVKRDEGQGGPRVGMLETVREHARGLLESSGELDATARAHALFYRDLAEAAQGLQGRDQPAWLARFEVEHDNVRAVLRWARDGGDVGLGLELASQLWRFWHTRGHHREGVEQLSALLDLGGGAVPVVRARALQACGNLTWPQADYARAVVHFEAALALFRDAGDQLGAAQVVGNLGLIASQRGDLEPAAALIEESLHLRRRLGDHHGVAVCLNNLALVFSHQGDLDRTGALLEEALALRRRLGDALGIVTCLINLGDLARQTGDYDRAASLLTECLDMCRELQDDISLAKTLNNLGDLARARGDGAGAIESYGETLRLALRKPDPTSVCYSLEGVAAAAAMLEGGERAARLYAAADALRERNGTPLQAAYRAEHQAIITRVREVIGEEDFSAAWTAGRELSAEEAAAEAVGSLS